MHQNMVTYDMNHNKTNFDDDDDDNSSNVVWMDQP